MANFNSKIINLAFFWPRWYSSNMCHTSRYIQSINNVLPYFCPSSNWLCRFLDRHIQCTAPGLARFPLVHRFPHNRRNGVLLLDLLHVEVDLLQCITVFSPCFFACPNIRQINGEKFPILQSPARFCPRKSEMTHQVIPRSHSRCCLYFDSDQLPSQLIRRFGCR